MRSDRVHVERRRDRLLDRKMIDRLKDIQAAGGSVYRQAPGKKGAGTGFRAEGR
jgi:hypothetical protein